nr:hypothetical protein [Acidimicrobiia bacterium]
MTDRPRESLPDVPVEHVPGTGDRSLRQDKPVPDGVAILDADALVSGDVPWVNILNG